MKSKCDGCDQVWGQDFHYLRGVRKADEQRAELCPRCYAKLNGLPPPTCDKYAYED